jgi:hypothetical protein
MSHHERLKNQPCNPELNPCFPRAWTRKDEYNQEEEKKQFPFDGKML